MLDGVMLLWFALTTASVLFVAADIRRTPESPVLKWGFVLLAAYTGPVGAFLYVLGCREPLTGLHERYVAVRWRQVLGSTMHCVAGDGVGILAGAALAGVVHTGPVAEITLEYVLGFGFGWTVFQALFMRDMVGGSYVRSLKATFIPELLSMNLLMAGMVPTMAILKTRITGDVGPSQPAFWFVMSMALLAGFIAAYPINWWLVSRQLKHGMMTVRPPARTETPTAGPAEHEAHAQGQAVAERPDARASGRAIAAMSGLSFLALAVGLAVSFMIMDR